MAKIILTENQLVNLIKNTISKLTGDSSKKDDLKLGDVIKNIGGEAKKKFEDLFGDTSDDMSKKGVEDFFGELRKKSDKTYKPIDVDSKWMDITTKVIDKLEGGYWNPKCDHPRSGMGKSTETLFGLDRYNGNIESTPEGQEFFSLIDKEKKELGKTGFCKKWKWLFRGGEKESKLKNLAAKIMKKRFDSNLKNFVEDEETKTRILSDPRLLMHMSYATWNGSGFFQKFANSLEDGVKRGLSDDELVDLAIKDRSQTRLLNKSKIEKVIRDAKFG